MNKTIYRQYDSRWGSKPYPTKGSSFAGNGCGCVSITHILIERDKYKNYTPEPVRKYMVSKGFAVPNHGTTWSGITKTLEHYGYKVYHIGSSDPMSKAWKELNKGNRIGIILFSGGAGPDGTVWTGGGHYMAFTGYKVQDGKHRLYMKDSGPRRHDGWYYYEKSMKGKVFQMWIVENIGTKPEDPNKDIITGKIKLDVDGIFDAKCVNALEKTFGLKQDGYIGGQAAVDSKYHTGFEDGVISYSSGASSVVKKLQKYLKLKDVDGQLGPNTIKALQKYLKMSNPDGIWGKNTSKAVQKWLNTNPVIVIEKEEKEPNKKKIEIKGLDLSNYQGKISVKNFKKVKKQGYKFVILRIGYTGSSSKRPTIDASFENNYRNAKSAGLDIGIYYYSLATTKAKAIEEAKFCIKNLKNKPITYPVYIDIEDSKQINCSTTTLANVGNSFCKTITDAKLKAGVYASVSWFNHKIGKINSSYSKWVAQYYHKCEYGKPFDIWQYTSSAKVSGISGKVDANICYKEFK